MPPPEKTRPPVAELSRFTSGLAHSLVPHERSVEARQGRATQRRMNRDEYENALQDLFHAPWLQVKGQFPEDGEAHRFNKIGDALDVSYVQMARFMTAADTAMRQTLAVKLGQLPSATTRYYARDQQSFITRYTQGLNLPQHTRIGTCSPPWATRPNPTCAGGGLH